MTEPTRTIPQRQLRNDISAILREVEGGATLRVTVGGRPVADLVPISSRQRFVPRAVIERILRDAPLDPRFERDVADALDDRTPDSPYDG
ncbi:MAG: type II toxin-antitoxin system prevent-host-death family antitoxin [Chloroflexota bacterium]|nr:type II toxin-antitoxin system prevent-host-death family antitoxin [Chloroflexota bacterium]